MTDLEIALTVLHARRDNAWMQRTFLLASYPSHSSPLSTYADALREEYLYDALTGIIMEIEERTSATGLTDSDDDRYTDAEADADTLASAGWGTDEDYGYYGDGDE